MAIIKNQRFHRGLELTKSSWRVLILDKELLALPLLSLVFCVITIIGGIAGFFGLLTALYGGSFSTTSPIPLIIFGVIMYILLAIIGNYFSGAIIYGATQRFRGGDPDVRHSLKGVAQKFGPIALFSLVMATVGLLIGVMQNRLPFLARLSLNLFGAAWSIANVFALPVIVLADKKVMPFTATRESVKTIRKIWGESVIADFGISLIGLLGVAGYICMWVLFGIFDAQIGGVPELLRTALFIIGLMGFISLLVVISTLSAITKAALYHFAVTGEAPELFNRELLQTAMTPKKARRIFS